MININQGSILSAVLHLARPCCNIFIINIFAMININHRPFGSAHNLNQRYLIVHQFSLSYLAMSILVWSKVGSTCHYHQMIQL